VGLLQRTALAPLAFLFFVFLCAVGSPHIAFAQSATFLSGTITASGKPAAAVTVVATGSNLTLKTQTDTNGSFTFAAVPIGTYNLDATGPGGTGALRVDVTSSGARVTLDLSPYKNIGRTAVTARPPVTGSGTDLDLSADLLKESPANGSLPDLLIQLPGAARGANGVVHINGDHGDVNYIVDGVPIPQELNRDIGTEFDPNDIAFVEVLQGAYPAQYGERFASVINVNTLTGSGPPGFTGEFNAGAFQTLDGDLAYHTNVGKGSFIVAVRDQQTNRGLDPPNPDSPHDNATNTNEFLRFTEPVGTDFLNLTLSHTYQTYQIPNDIDAGEPATTDDDETQDDVFGTLQFRHPIGDHGSLTFGPSFKRSQIRDFGDPANDFIFGETSNVTAGGSPTDCADALASSGPIVNGIVTNPVANPNVAYVNGTCGYSLNGNRTAVDVGGVLDYDNRSPHHDVKFGGVIDATHVDKDYAVTLQPGNFLAPILTPATPDAPYTVVDDNPNVGHLTALYLQDSWKLGDLYQLDYGLRQDEFIVSSTDFREAFGQTSPRIKFTRFLGARTSIYAFYGRFFTPFSLENVGPVAAYTLNLPTGLPPAQFDLKPQRDSVYEAGAHVGIGSRGDLGLRIMQKNATDLIDDTQVGVTNLHQDINYALGRIATQTAYFQQGLSQSSRLYISATHTYSVNKDCETQLLAPCFPENVNGSLDWTPADHDQRVDVTAGIIANDAHGGWFAVDSEYGSGLSTGLNPTGGITCAGPGYTLDVGGPCKFTPHLTFDFEKGIPIGPGVDVTIRLQNIFNDEYLVTYLNAQGNHYAPPRELQVGLRFNTAK
jgi:hypothetical protein